MAVACGDDYTMAVDEHGQVIAVGSNLYNELGIQEGLEPAFRNDSRHAFFYPTHVHGLPAPARQVATGKRHTAFVTDDGDLLMCGKGRGPGLGGFRHYAMPTLVERTLFGNESVLMVACGGNHTVVVTEGGSLYTFGDGEHGQLGHGRKYSHSVPRRVAVEAFQWNIHWKSRVSDQDVSQLQSSLRIVMVAAGDYFTVALSDAGHVFTWGHNLSGQLGLTVPPDYESGLFLEPEQVDPKWFKGSNVVFVAAGLSHTVAVTEEGMLYTWGNNSRGQLGLGGFKEARLPTLVDKSVFRGAKVVMAACGSSHTVVVTDDGSLWACGFDVHDDEPTLTKETDGHMLKRVMLTFNQKTDCPVFKRVGEAEFGGARVVTAACGDSTYTVAVTEDGALWTWRPSENLRRLLSVPYTRSFHRVFSIDSNLGTTRFGRCHRMTASRKLALAMGTHRRLGVSDRGVTLPVSALKDDIMKEILSLSHREAWPPGLDPENQSLAPLLGGLRLE